MHYPARPSGLPLRIRRWSSIAATPLPTTCLRQTSSITCAKHYPDRLIFEDQPMKTIYSSPRIERLSARFASGIAVLLVCGGIFCATQIHAAILSWSGGGANAFSRAGSASCTMLASTCPTNAPRQTVRITGHGERARSDDVLRTSLLTSPSRSTRGPRGRSSQHAAHLSSQRRATRRRSGLASA